LKILNSCVSFESNIKVTIQFVSKFRISAQHYFTVYIVLIVITSFMLTWFLPCLLIYCLCCCMQAAHKLVTDRLLKYVYSGFLESVMGPALHQVRITAFYAKSPHTSSLPRENTLKRANKVIVCTFF